MKIEPPPPGYQVELDGCCLWRDGARAVVSLKLNGRWVRVAEAPAHGIFNEARTRPELAALSWRAYSASVRYRLREADYARSPRTPRLKEAAE